MIQYITVYRYFTKNKTVKVERVKIGKEMRQYISISFTFTINSHHQSYKPGTIDKMDPGYKPTNASDNARDQLELVEKIWQ